MTLRDDVFQYAKKTYKTKPEYLWRRAPGYAVLRHEDNQKWYGLVMDVPKNKLGLQGEEIVDILNVKLDDPYFIDLLMREDGYFRGYHFGKGNWISILLDGTVPFEDICRMIDTSYTVTASRKKKQEARPPKEWIVPANPRYFDIQQAFDQAQEIDWKQGKGIKAGDTVYMYVAAPVSAILYKCKVTKTDIPFIFSNENVSMTALMKVKLQKRYKPDKFTFTVLKEEYGVNAIRGPRGIPYSLSEDLKK